MQSDDWCWSSGIGSSSWSRIDEEEDQASAGTSGLATLYNMAKDDADEVAPGPALPRAELHDVRQEGEEDDCDSLPSLDQDIKLVIARSLDRNAP